MKKILIVQGLLIQSLLVLSSEIEFIDSNILYNLEDPLVIGFSYGRYDDSLDILNYADKLNSTKPKKATTDSYFISYQFNKFKLAYESFDSSGSVERISQPKSLETNVDGESFSIAYKILDYDERFIEIGFFKKEEKQEPVTIDCYAFGSTVVGGSCEEAKLRVLDSDIYKSSGDLVYEPVLTTSGDSDSEGIYLRITPKTLNLLSFVHTFSYKTSDVNQGFQSAILNTTDSFIRGLNIEGRNAGDLLDQFKNELPQETPWKENRFKYSVSKLLPIGKSFALSGMYSFIKVKRKHYINNPTKEDFNNNHLVDLSLFYGINDNILLYMKLSASSNYLLGENPLAYNRRSNHLFDHPYGQLSAGLLINF